MQWNDVTNCLHTPNTLRKNRSVDDDDDDDDDNNTHNTAKLFTKFHSKKNSHLPHRHSNTYIYN